MPLDDPSPEADEALRDLICLTLVPGVGPHTCRALLDSFGTAAKVLAASTSALRQVPGVGPKLADAVSGARRDRDVDAEIEECRRSGVSLLGRGWPGYPTSLEEIPDPPPCSTSAARSARSTPWRSRSWVRGSVLPTG